jgi:hypothetical protein
MPTYTVLLAQEVTYYGNVSVEGDTWEEAVASLVLDDWDTNYMDFDGAWGERVVHVETESGDIVAEDIAFDCPMIHCQSVIQRLREIQIAADPDAALALFIDDKTRSSTRRATMYLNQDWMEGYGDLSPVLDGMKESNA